MREGSRGHRPGRRFVALLVGMLLVSTAVATAAGAADTSTTTAPPGGWPAVNEPGVTSDSIRVSGVASTTNSLGGQYGTAFDGVQAYFNMINRQGGIYGRSS